MTATGRQVPEVCNVLRGVKLAVPYTPNLAEYLILQNRRILADQMEFLKAFARKKAKPGAKLR